MWKSTFVRASQLPTARRPATQRLSAARMTTDESVVLGRYRLGGCLGAGSFGTVWRAHDEHLGREVAVKVLPRRRVMDARFEREARAAARLSHPGIVTLYEAAADNESAYLVSELVRGATLDQVLEAGRLSDRDIVSVGIALCEALAHAHSRGVVHRDVKPSNVLIPERPASSTYPAKLTDFGIARVIGGDSLTRTGDVVGTDAYMAPEQAVGREAGASADLYALALVLYEALTGVNPVAVDGRRSTRLGAHLPPLRRQRRDLPRELGRGIDLALRPRPRERGTIEEFQAALVAALDELSDVSGVVEGPWRPRISLLSGRPVEVPRIGTEHDRLRIFRHAPEDDRGTGARSGGSLLERGLGIAGAAALAAWLAAHVLGAATGAPAVAGLLAARLVLVLPRVGFGLIALALILAAGLGGHAGLALMLGLGALIPIALLPRSGSMWPLASGAPALAAIGLAGAWPALAARAGSCWRRAALGAAGWLWLALATALRGSPLYLSTPAGLPNRSVWGSSVYDSVHEVLPRVLSGGVLSVALVWAVAACVLPPLVRARSLATSVIRVAAWATLVVACAELFLRSASAGPAVGTAIIGALASAAVALFPALSARWRTQPRMEEPRAGLP